MGGLLIEQLLLLEEAELLGFVALVDRRDDVVDDGGNDRVVRALSMRDRTESVCVKPSSTSSGFL